MRNTLLLVVSPLFLFLNSTADAQNIGIGTDTPQRNLEIYGLGQNYLRLTSFYGNNGIELTRVGGPGFQQDWRIHNNVGDFTLDSAPNSFEAGAFEILRVKPNGKLGLGTSSPEATLHIGQGDDATNAGGGFLTAGVLEGLNLTLDNNELLVRNNGSPAALHLQAEGGNTIVAENGGWVSIGTNASGGRLSVANDAYQLYLRNEGTGLNEWFIGASNGNWASGDKQLVFTPTGSSSDAMLRLRDIQENDGTTAPISIISGNNTQRILMDGNEIDCTTGALYINRNTSENTILNPNGGNVGIGHGNPNASLHILTGSDEIALNLQSANGNEWGIKPTGDGGNNMHFVWEGTFKSGISLVNGDYFQSSDRRLKESIRPLDSTLDKIDKVGTYSYYYQNRQTDQRSIGVMAQELQDVYPELVYEQNDHYAVAYGPLSVIAIKGIQELKEQNTSQQDEIDELKRLVAILLNDKTSKR